mgnify:CR=1 FL=1
MSARFERSLGAAIALMACLFQFSFGADVAPFDFGNVDDQKYWDDLLKYKIFGAHGIDFEGYGFVLKETAGYTGTADGDVTFIKGKNQSGNSHDLGGPLLVGKNLVYKDGQYEDRLFAGPTRVLGNVVLNSQGKMNNTQYQGEACVKGSVNDATLWNKIVQGKTYGSFKDAYGNYYSCPDSVPNVDDFLNIPSKGEHIFDRTISSLALTSGETTIDVPALPEGSSKKSYDILVKGDLSFTGSDSKVSLYLNSAVTSQITLSKTL